MSSKKSHTYSSKNMTSQYVTLSVTNGPSFDQSIQQAIDYQIDMADVLSLFAKKFYTDY